MKQVLVFGCDSCSFTDTDERTVSYHEKQHVRDREERLLREATGQLTISQIREKCEDLPPNLPIVVFCESDPRYHGAYPSKLNSYRGYYDELAIDVSHEKTMSLDVFAEEMRRALYRTYFGYKGGEYSMYDETFVWLAEYGDSTQIIVKDIFLSPSRETVHLVAEKLKSD